MAGRVHDRLQPGRRAGFDLFRHPGRSAALFGFGIDSFIEVLSGIGILAMVLRIRHDREGQRSRFERTALRVTGTAFYLLAAGLALSAAYNLVKGH